LNFMRQKYIPNGHRDTLFEILGFDVMVDSDNKPWLSR
jgi:hypothetical protein